MSPTPSVASKWKDTHYPGGWTIFGAMIAAALQLGQHSNAIQYSRELTSSNSMKLSEILEARLEAAVVDWDSGNRETAHADLEAATELACQGCFR